MKRSTSVLLTGTAMLMSSFAWAQYDPQCEDNAQYALDSQVCYQAREKHFDGVLNQSYQALMKQQNSAGKAQLRQMQRAWIRERDTECRAVVGRTAAGAGVAGDKCLADFTEDRALEMRSWLKQGKRF